MFARAFVESIPFSHPPQEEQQSGVESRARTTGDTPIAVQEVNPHGIMGYGQSMATVREENRRSLAGNLGARDPPSRDPPIKATRPRSSSRRPITYDMSAVRPSSLNPSFVAELPGPVVEPIAPVRPPRAIAPAQPTLPPPPRFVELPVLLRPHPATPKPLPPHPFPPALRLASRTSASVRNLSVLRDLSDRFHPVLLPVREITAEMLVSSQWSRAGD